MNSTQENIVAVEIAKRTLRIQTSLTSFEVANTEEGIDALLEAVESIQEPWFVCEATGGYERPLLRRLFASGVNVSVINPARVRAFAKSEGLKAKTDKIDAKVLLRFAQEKTLRLALPPESDREKIAALLDRRSHLAASLTREKNRLEKKPVHTGSLIEESVQFLKQQIAKIDDQIDAIIKANDELTKARDRLTEIKGVAKLTASTVLAYLPEITSVNRNQLIALAGLAPFNADSGDSTGKRYIQGGRAKLRRYLYMAAQSAAQHNPIIKNYVAGLVARGKPYKSALVAAMRKILICMQSLLKNPNFSLDPEHSC